MGLRPYYDDKGMLARDLANNSPGLTAKITGLMIQEADSFYASHNANNWNGLSEANRDGLRVMYFSYGPKMMEEKYQQNINTSTSNKPLGVYKPELDGYGSNDRGLGGGRWHIDNSTQLTQIMGVDYAGYIAPAQAGVTVPLEPSQTAAPDLLTTLDPLRPSSTSLIDYANPYTAVLKAGGTLSDIVAIERANGNEITIHELRLFNGLTPDMDTKLQIGERLVVPKKIGPNLEVNYGDVHLSMNSADGTYTYIINKADTNTTVVYRRARDTVTGEYLDQYSETDNATGLPVGVVSSQVDPNYAALVNPGTSLQKYVDPATGNIVTATTTSDGTTTAVTTDPDGQVVATQVRQNDGLTTLLNTIDHYGPTLVDSLSLIKAIQTGQPLPIVASGLRLAADLSVGDPGHYQLSGASNMAGGVLSLMSLDAALKRGDTLGAVTSGAQAISFGAQAYAEFASSKIGTAAITEVFGQGSAVAGLQQSLPYLNLVNSLVHGDEVGIAVSIISMIPGMQWLQAAYAVYSMIDSLFSDNDIPDPWGNARFVWNGTGISIEAVGETGGKEAVEGVLSSSLAAMNALITQVQQQNPGSQLGIIPNRMPGLGYGMDGYRYTDIDPLSGAEKHPALRFDTTGRPYNAEPGTPESFMSLGEAFIRSALARGAIAPLWEVQTAKMQTDAGDPKAGLTEEARAGRDGQLAAPITGNTQTFRPVALDLDGDGIETIGKAVSGVNFDVDDSGYLKHTGWLAGDDAFLVLDRDYNGSADSGRELFSNATVALGKRGLAGMAWVDANYDGKITSVDPVWNELRVWRDADADGQQDAGETKTLAELGISELNYAMATYQANGQTRQLASPDLEADKDGTRINVVPEGILIQNSNGGNLSLLVTRIDDKTAVEANRDGITSYEDVETIVSGADLLANDRLGGFLGRDLSITGLTNLRHGTGFIDSNGLVHFTPEANYAGDGAGFDYIVRAANGQTGAAGVDITLQNVNDAPMAADQRIYKPIYGYTPRQTSTDDSGRSLPTGGDPIYQPYALRRSFFGAGTIIYDPAPGQPDLEYHTTPVAYEDTGDGKIAGSDVDDPANSLTYQVVGTPQYGEVTLDAAGNYDYTSWIRPGQPSADAPTQCYAGAIRPGADAFQVKVSDPHGASTLLTVTVPHPDPYFPPPPPSSGGGGCCPVAVDLDRNGFSFTPAEDSGVFFDINADGWKRQASWTKPGDGWLAYDANGNGAVDDGSEIVFSRYARTAQGDLQSLAEAFDTDHDSRLTAADEKWARFGIWQDANQNGVTDAGEFRSLSSMGVVSVGLVSDGAFAVQDGNTIHGVAKITMSDGSTLDAADVTLRVTDNVRVSQPGGASRVVTQSPFSPNGEVLDGTADKDLILGKSGNNIVNGYAGDDVIFEDGGNDVIDAGDGDDLVYAGADNDLVMGGKGNDAVYAGLGDDLVFGGDGHDAILAEGGNDVAFAGAGNDLISGGAGNDTYVVDDRGDVVTELAGENNDTVRSSLDGYVLGANIENLTLTDAFNPVNPGSDTDSRNPRLDRTASGNELDNVIIGNRTDNTLYGGAGADTLDGGFGADTLVGGAGDDTYVADNAGDTVLENAGEGLDTIKTGVSAALSANVENLVLTGAMAINGIGNGLDNQLLGNAGDNRLDGGAGADFMAGGRGNDIYVIDQMGDVIVENAGEGVDMVISGIDYRLGANLENLTLTGVADTTATGNEGGNVLTGNDGNNVLDGDAGADTLAGGGGNDAYVVDDAGDFVIERTGEGVDSVRSGISFALTANVENLTLTGFAAIDATGNELDNVLTGNSGENRLDGSAGADIMTGGAGDDSYIVDDAGDMIVESPGEGMDVVHASVSYTLSAHVENLMLTGDADINAIGNDLANALTGNSGRNVLDGEAGADTMAAGAGDDTYVVDNAADTVTENDNEGVDTIRASVGYTLSDNVENLTLIGNADIDGKGNGLANVLSGNTGANLLDGGLGTDAMAGGAGNDTYIVDNSGDSIAELVNEGVDSIFSSVSYITPANVDNLTLTGSADIDATGNDLDNILAGNTGGNIVDGGGGADTMKGGRGDDTYKVDNASDTIWEAAGEGIDNIHTSVSYVLPENVENLYLVGNGAINGGGNDADNLLIGNGANNVLSGGGGYDTLDGSAGDDRLEGGLGNDILIGGLGQDGLEGGEGDDTYLINQGDGLDRINDVAGTDTVLFGAGLSLDNVALRVTQENGAYTAHVRVLGAAGCEQADQGFDFAVTKDSSGHYVTPIENFQFADGSVKTFDDLLIKTNIVQSSAQTTVIITGRNDDIIYAGPMSNIVRAGSGHDIVYAGPGGDTVFGEGGDDYIQGSTGDDTQDGGCGTDVLAGANGRDLLRDPDGNNAFLAGFQNDRIEAGAGSDFIAGGKHDDTISTGGGANVIAFNRNDGRDTILPGTGASNTLSVGGGIMAGDLSFGRSGQDLMLNAGNGDFITFKDWYTGEDNRNFVTLQIIDDDPNRGPGGLFGHRVEAFDFRALVNKFDAAGAGNSTLPAWSLMNGLLDTHLNGSDSAALGGEISVRYAEEGSLAMSPGAVQDVLRDPRFGVQPQNIGGRIETSVQTFRIG